MAHDDVLGSNTRANLGIARQRLTWERPLLKPLPRLGELTTPTTFSASSPDRHGSDIGEFRSHGVKDSGGV